MSDDNDRESKTEQPSQKRISDTLEKGNTPFSREAVVFTSLLAALAVLNLSGPAVGRRVFEILGTLYDTFGQRSLENGRDFVNIMRATLVATFVAVLPLFVGLSIGGIVGSIGQNVPSASLDRLMPRIERISPAANFKRIFGPSAVGEFLKSTGKIIVVTLLLYRLFKSRFINATLAMPADATAMPSVLLESAKALLAPVCVFAFLVAIADLIWARMKWYKGLRMTRQELKEEMKQSEGDAQLKERIKAIGRARVRKRMMAQLPKATMVVVNPTHYAVAMRYVPSEGGAPVVIAKGLDSLALKIRSICEENNIAVIEDKPLARSLHKNCEIGEMIPPEFYKAVAEIVHYIEMRKRIALRRAG